jgi:hypothetical protein
MDVYCQGLEHDVACLRAEVARLREEIAALRECIDDSTELLRRISGDHYAQAQEQVRENEAALTGGEVKA